MGDLFNPGSNDNYVLTGTLLVLRTKLTVYAYTSGSDHLPLPFQNITLSHKLCREAMQSALVTLLR